MRAVLPRLPFVLTAFPIASLLITSCTPPSPSLSPSHAPSPPRPPTPSPPPAAHVAPLSPSAASWRDVSHAAKLARDAGDFASYRTHVIALESLLSGHPDVVLSLAGADAQLNHKDAAFASLRRIARMGLVVDLDGERDLAPLRDDPSYAELKRAIAANARPIARATRLFDLPSQELITEDITYDPAAHAYFVSSVRARKILVVQENGAARDFASELPYGAFAVAYDPIRSTLWATTAAIPQTAGHRKEDAGHTAVLTFDRKTGALASRVDLAASGPKHVLGDAALGHGGELVVSDGFGGGVYAVKPGATTFETIVPEGTLASPQTCAPTADGARIFVPDYVRGIAVVDRATHALTWLAHADDVALNGIDGLYLRESTLIAIQNGVTPPRIVRLTLDGSGARVTRLDVLERGTPGFGEPTHGVVVGNALRFIANAGWNRFDDDGARKPDAPPDAPAIWSLPLDI